MVNRYNHDIHIKFNWEKHAKVPRGIYNLRDLWKHKDIGIIDTSKDGEDAIGDLGSHDNWAFRLIFIKNVSP